MRIYFGSLATAMTQQRLYVVQVCTIFQQMCGKTLP